jgi:hypothetical protein
MTPYKSLPLRVMYRKLKHEVEVEEKAFKKRRFGNPKAAGKYGVDRVKLQITEKIGWACTTEETDSSPIDIFAITLEPPFKIALIQVKSVYGNSRSVHVYEKDISYERGIPWVISAETEPDKFAYLVFSYKEWCKITLNSKSYEYEGRAKEWDVNVPKSLAGFEEYQDKWHKIDESAMPIFG